MSNTGANIVFTTSIDGEDCQVKVGGHAFDLFNYQYDVDELMCDFDWTMFDFEAYVATIVNSPVKIHWLNVEREEDQHFIFRLESPAKCDVIYVRVRDVEGTACFDIFGFDIPRPCVRTPGIHEYDSVTHTEHACDLGVFNYDDF